MWGESHSFNSELETKSNYISVNMARRGSRVAPAPPQTAPAAKMGTFIDDDFDTVTPVTPSKPNSKEGGKRNDNSPHNTRRHHRGFQVEGDTPYAMDVGAQFGHGTQNAIDEINDELDEELAHLDLKLDGVMRHKGDKSTGLRGIKERGKAKFHVEKGKKKFKKTIGKMHLVRGGLADDGVSFVHASSSSEDEDDDALMSGLNSNDGNNGNGGGNGGVQLVTTIDPNIKKQLILALKMKRTYKSALQGVSDKFRKSLVEIDKMHVELAKAQEELNIAHTQAARNGVGSGATFRVSNSNESKRDEEDRARRDRERKKLLMASGGGGAEEIETEIDSNQPQALRLCKKLGNLYNRYKPLRGDVIKIEQRFGTSVASYFHFYQWIFLNSIIVWLLYFSGFGYHMYLNTNLCVDPNDATGNNYKSRHVQFIACRPMGICEVANPDLDLGKNTTDGVGLGCHYSDHCYDFNADETSKTLKSDKNGYLATGVCTQKYKNLVLGRLSFAFETSTAGSWVPELFMFSSFQANEAWIYTVMLLGSIFVMMIQTVIKWSAEDRKLKMITAFEGSQAKQNKYAKLVLNSWDHNLHSVREIRDHKLFIAESLRMLVQDAEAQNASGSRTFVEKAKLYARRGFFILLYIIIQIGGMALIVITLAGQSPTIKTFGEYVYTQTSGALEITPIVVGIVNGVVPQLTTRLLKQEKYDDQGTVIKQTVLRIFLTKTFNILIQVVSYLLLQDPFLFAAVDSPPQFLGKWHQSIPVLQMISLRSVFKKAFGTVLDSAGTKADFANACRVNQVGLNLFSFLYIAFATEIVMAFLFPGIAWLTAKIKKKPIKKAQFDVALKMIGLLYFMQICLFTMPFMPFVGCIFIFLLFIKFKMEFFLTNKFGKKPKKAWAAKDSGEFFLKFFLVSVFIWIAINYLFLKTTTQAKQCSAQFKFLAQTTELDGTSYPRMNLISEECDLLWHDLEGSSSSRSAIDPVWDNYIILPPRCESESSSWFGTELTGNQTGYVNHLDQPCRPCPLLTEIGASASEIKTCSGVTATMQDLANYKYGIEQKSSLEWANMGLTELRSNTSTVLKFTNADTGASNWQQLPLQKIGALEKAFYKPKCGGQPCKLEGGEATDADQQLTVRRSFRIWLDKVTGVSIEGLSQVEKIQKADLNDDTKCIRPYCTSVNGTVDTTNCGLCGPTFIPKYKAIRSQKKYYTNGTADVRYVNPFSKIAGPATKSYKDFSITNNERMVMCACYKGVGPYADSENGFQSIRELAAVYSVVASLYAILVSSTLFSWFIGASVMILLLFAKNSATVSTDYAADQRFYFSDQITGLNRRNQALQKKYNRLRMAVDS